MNESQIHGMNKVILHASLDKATAKKVESIVKTLVDDNLKGKASQVQAGSITLRVIALVEKTTDLLTKPLSSWEEKMIAKVLEV